MKFTKLVPNIFYEDIKVGLKLFIDCLEFSIGYDDLNSKDPCCVAKKDELAIFILQNKEVAEKDRPEIRLQTDDIAGVYEKIAMTHPELLHPNGKTISMKPWGAKEFALLDESGICIIIQQW
ncbi:MAG: hypothetical protein ABJA78_06435 [Ferruginibacter sp.]